MPPAHQACPINGQKRLYPRAARSKGRSAPVKKLKLCYQNLRRLSPALTAHNRCSAIASAIAPSALLCYRMDPLAAATPRP